MSLEWLHSAEYRGPPATCRPYQILDLRPGTEIFEVGGRRAASLYSPGGESPRG